MVDACCGNSPNRPSSRRSPSLNALPLFSRGLSRSAWPVREVSSTVSLRVDTQAPTSVLLIEHLRNLRLSKRLHFGLYRNRNCRNGSNTLIVRHPEALAIVADQFIFCSVRPGVQLRTDYRSIVRGTDTTK